MKLQATRLLLEHTEDTFVTPVFNGSASLRDAAGQLIEDVTKSVRRKQTVDGAYLDRLYSDTAWLGRGTWVLAGAVKKKRAKKRRGS